MRRVVTDQLQRLWVPLGNDPEFRVLFDGSKQVPLTAVHLDVTAKVPGATPSAFETAANNAKAGCPISRVLNATITMAAKLEPQTNVIDLA